jgi:hypothetical protein
VVIIRIERIAVLLLLGDEGMLLIELDLAGPRGKKRDFSLITTDRAGVPSRFALER